MILMIGMMAAALTVAWCLFGGDARARLVAERRLRVLAGTGAGRKALHGVVIDRRSISPTPSDLGH
jgi:hypothetical protein